MLVRMRPSLPDLCSLSQPSPLHSLSSPLSSSVLKGIEDAKAKGVKGSALDAAALKLASEHLGSASPAAAGAPNPAAAAARADAVSHFVLRLAYSRSEDLRRWFLALEADLFRARFRAMLPASQAAFISAHGLPFAPVPPGDWAAVRPGLAALTEAAGVGGPAAARRAAADIAGGATPPAAFYKVPFEAVPDLVATRRALLVGGSAFVSRADAASLVAGEFRAGLARGLLGAARTWGAMHQGGGGGGGSAAATAATPAGARAARGRGAAAAPPSQDEADRLAPVVASLAGRYLGADYGAEAGGAPGGPITAADIPALSSSSFPLCMQAMLSGLTADHHLKHKGRLQLGLFLKGAGLPLEEAMRFWRTHFGPKCGGDDFDKRYAYSIRFNYGREGRRADYTPYSCVKIITTPVDAGDCAGCPYKTLAPAALAAALSKAHVPPAAAAAAAAKAAAGHFQLACAAAWEGAHPGHELESAGVSHPNQYYDESRRARAADAEGAAAAAGGMGVVEGGKGGGVKVEAAK